MRVCSTVGEFIEQLKKFPPNTPIGLLSRGDEEGDEEMIHYFDLEWRWFDDYDGVYPDGPKPESAGNIEHTLVIV